MNLMSLDIQTDASPGLRCDAEIVAQNLSSKFSVRVNVCTKNSWSVHCRRFISKFKRFFGFKGGVGIFVEDLRSRWFGAFDYNILIPNQEWMRPNTKLLLGRCDEIWCKSRYAESIFLQLGCRVKYIGFTSADRFLPNISKDFESFIHIQGRSGSKGTSTILHAWEKHVNWPMLTIVTRDSVLLEHDRHNIKIIVDFLTDEDLNVCMNSRGIHLCTSEAEGFGHTINEALSTGALVISTDAPPMNELVRPQFGFLVPYTISTPAGLGEKFKVSVDDLEKKIEEVMALDGAKKRQMSQLARQSYLQSRSQFHDLLLEAADNVFSSENIAYTNHE
jgi:Glycosyl transferases group 1